MSVTRALFKNLAANFVNSTFADFTKPFTIEKLTRTDDGQGGLTASWVTFANTRGFVEKSGGGEIVETTAGATKIDDNDMFTFQFQFINGITDDMRLNYQGEVYNIKSVKPLQDVDIWLIIQAEKGEPT